MEYDEHIVFFVPTKEIFYGAHERLTMRLGIKVGMLGDGKRDLQQVTVVLMPSLVSALKDPMKGVTVSGKDRITQIIAKDILPQFQGKENTRVQLQHYLRAMPTPTQVSQKVKEELSNLAFGDFTEAQTKFEINKYMVNYEKVMTKKVGKKVKAYQEALEFVEKTVCVICDEVHRVKGETWFDTILKFTNAQYRIGMTGTIDYKNKLLWRRLEGLFGQVVNRIANEELINRGFSAKPYIQMVTVKKPELYYHERDYATAYRQCIVENPIRNKVIANMAETLYNKGKTTLIIVNIIDHGERLLQELTDRGIVAEFIHGELDTETRKRQLQDVKDGKLRVLIATTVLDEGVDISGIHALIMTAGGKSLRQTLQRVGRILRRKEGDNSAIVIDFIDRTNPFMYKHSEDRLKLYQEEGFDINYLN